MEFDCSKKVWKEEECHVAPHLEWVGSREYDDQIFVTGRRDASPKLELCDGELVTIHISITSDLSSSSVTHPCSIR